MRKIMLGLLLVLAACRSLPRGVADANDVSNRESAAIVALWEQVAKPNVHRPDSTLVPSELLAQLNQHRIAAMQAREVIQDYLDSAHGDKDAALGFNVATELLKDIDINVALVFFNWEQWINPGSDTAQFITEMDVVVARFKELNRKFNEWRNQFKVK